MGKRKICVVTGTRAEYGLLYWLMKGIQLDPDLELQIIATGMHLSPEFGLTYRDIEDDGFVINEKVEMLLSSDTTIGITKALGLGTIGFADSLNRLKPDILVLLGDRFEILAAAQAAMIAKIPIAHIHGGEVTYGAYDDSIRHSITKMSYLHFVTTEVHRKRVIRLGEHPSRVYNVGAPGIENIMKLPLLSKNELEQSLGILLEKPVFLITHHPTTLGSNPIEGTEELLEALNCFSGATMIFTKANADDHGRTINHLIGEYVSKDPNRRKFFDSLGQIRYLSLLKYADVIIGNSSSGLIEAPYLETPTVNIGNRQKGRVRPHSVFDCSPETSDIADAIRKALHYQFKEEHHYKIFGVGETSIKIIEVLKKIQIDSIAKEFYDGEIL
ncbi:UDP-N-acetylglucosamine 2-epimerase [Anoxybacillus flavithermus]|uniref:UDP-N-acetylglucosamine-2-epimerase n=1 Tax=Anoxybacillus flavithermus AK1 TaxID=1297581 RepID=M8D4W1_9BACL|nr:UDP-N-acetylglucosamine 2-epimerase [Anoxybacillus flavithermus]EMT45877.1 UDP-N-acetylglucosamine-2-epimerase [Anoxybacillus flavithermus AK1]